MLKSLPTLGLVNSTLRNRLLFVFCLAVLQGHYCLTNGKRNLILNSLIVHNNLEVSIIILSHVT